MSVDLPQPGEDPWGDTLNAAILGIDEDLQDTKGKKGQPSGYAELGPDGKVPSGQLPAQAGGGVTDHGNLTGLSDNDHPQYQLSSQKGQANGYASLGSDGLVPSGQLPAGGGTGGTGTPAVSRFVPVVIINGESNSGGYAENSQAPPSALLPRPAVQIFDNIGLASFQTLDIGTNNLIDHAGLDSYAGSVHGLELALANSVEAGQWWDDTVYLIKTGQGGSQISQWNVGGTYYTKFLDRTRNGLALLRSQGKIPVIYFWYSLGINDAIAGTNEASWKTSIESYHDRIRDELGFVPIFSTQFMASSPGVAFNDSVVAIAAANNMTYAIDASGTTTRDQNHWDYEGMKLMGERMVAASLQFGQHEGYIIKSISMLAGGTAMTAPADKPNLVRTPATVTFVEGSAGGTFTVALSKAPTANVVVSVSASGGNVVVSTPSLTFTTGNWSSAQTVTCTSPDDAGQNGSRTSTVTLSSIGVTSSATVGVTVTDAFVNPGPINTVLPAVTGSTALAGVVTCSQGTWNGSPTGYTYQWKRDALDIAGQTANTHTIVVADQGHVLTCTVAATNGQGTNTATSANLSVPADTGNYVPLTWKEFANTSESNGAIVTTGTMPSGANATTTIDPTKPFSVLVEWATSAETAGVVFMLDEAASTNFGWGAGQTFATACYQNTNKTYSAINDSSILDWMWTPTFPIKVRGQKSGNDVIWSTSPDGVTWTERYVHVNALVGKTTLYPRALFAVASANQKIKVSYDITTGAAPAVPANTVLPAITGSTAAGGVLTAGTGTWTGTPQTYAYQWKRDGSNLVGETTNQHTVVQADENHNISVTVTATNAQGSASATSANTAIPLPAAPANTGLPAITGGTALAAVLTCSTGTWSGNPQSYTYQWRRDAGAISGQTASTHTIVAADQTHDLSCVVTATNPQGSVAATSAAVAIPAASSLVPFTYQNITAASVDGNGYVVSAGGSSGANMVEPVDVTQPFALIIDWDSAALANATVVMLDDTQETSFGWTSPPQDFMTGCYETGGSTYSGINASTPLTWGYSPTFPLKVKMSKSGNDVLYHTSPDGNSWTLRYTHTGVLAGKTTLYPRILFAVGSAGQKVKVVYDSALLSPGAPVNTTSPAISGTGTTGSVLTCSTGIWAWTPTSYTYQWKRGGVDIAGQTANTHTIVVADEGTLLTCAVTATNAQGSNTATSAGMPISAGGITLTAVTWGTKSSASVVDDGGGKIRLTDGAGGQSAVATETLTINQPWEVEVTMDGTGVSNGVVVVVDDSNALEPAWGSSDFVVGTYHYNNALQCAISGSSVEPIGTALSGWPVRIKMVRVGDDVAFYRADGAAAYGAPLFTKTGVLAGLTGTAYLKCLWAVPGSGQYQTVKLAK